MKKIILCILSLILLTGCSNVFYVKDASNVVKSIKYDKIKSVWLTYYELSDFTKNNNADEFKIKINNAFEKISNMGFNTVTVQVRPCADAFYKSNYFPSSEYCFGEQGSDMPYDPLEIMCAAAAKNKIRIEAWINPYRVSQNDSVEALSDNNIAKKWHNSKKTKNRVYIADNKIFFNPASSEVQKLIINGVKEIVEKYKINAIHFDDYFYPTTNKDIDNSEYVKYKKKNGKLKLFDWRRENVNTLVKSVYRTIKSINKGVLFGISPAADINYNYNTLYADVKKWVNEDGYLDYICPQIYFGFKNIKQPFMFTTKKWLSMTNCKLYVGLPLYKCAEKDKYASDNDEEAINEFVKNDNIIARQINYISKIDDIEGFYVFSYSCLFNKKCSKEVDNMLKAMQNSSQAVHQTS